MQLLCLSLVVMRCQPLRRALYGAVSTFLLFIIPRNASAVICLSICCFMVSSATVEAAVVKA
nr:hypothetical protein [Vibrio cholerae]